jgi:hypothetical protein
MGLVFSDDGWRIPDQVWAEMESLLPAGLCTHSVAITRGFPTGTR